MKSLNKQQKIALMGLGLLTILIFVIAFFQFKLTIYGPFKKTVTQKGEKGLAELLNLRNVDTDKDGLNDFDELYVYKTSPYLEDTDSDGISDKKEIEQKTDPNCPEGKTCFKTTTTTPQNLENTAESELSSEQIRELLTKSGMDKETLDKIDDKTLRELYNETVQETGFNPGNLSNTSTSSSEQQAGELSLSIQEIRNLLLQEGLDKETLDQIDDETLKNLFLQALNSSETP